MGFGLHEHLKSGFAIDRFTQTDYPQRDHMDLLDRLGVLSVGINPSFVPSDRLAASPANPLRPTSGDNANDYAGECWYRSEEVTHEHSVPGTPAA
jgi:hypothetical protein